MKKLIVLLLLLAPAYLAAQSIERTGQLINRIDRQEGTAIHQQIVQTLKSTWSDMPLLTQAANGTAKSFKIVLQESVVTGDEGAAPEIAGVITNTSIVPINMVFERTHLRIDTNVSSSICLCSCYADFLDTLPANAACTLNAGTPNFNFLFHPHTIFGQSISLPDTIIDYIKLTALTGDPSDTVSFILSGVLMPVDAVQNQQKVSDANPRITAIYPSPLVQGSEIKVKVTSPRDCNLSYSIYDALGRVVALGVTRQHIGLGDNTIGIGSLDGLTNGSYMLKFNFGDGSNDTHFFQILR